MPEPGHTTPYRLRGMIRYLVARGVVPANAQNARLVYDILLSRAKPELVGEECLLLCYPGRQSIADDLCTSVKTIERAIRVLCEHGFIEVRQTGKTRADHAGVYVILPLPDDLVADGNYTVSSDTHEEANKRSSDSGDVANIGSSDTGEEAKAIAATQVSDSSDTGVREIALPLLISNEDIPKKRVTRAKRVSVPVRDNPPALADVVAYVVEQGYPPDLGRKAFAHYDPDWADRQNSLIYNWRNHIRNNWLDKRAKSSDKNRSETGADHYAASIAAVERNGLS